MTEFSVVVFRRSDGAVRAEPFLATKDPRVVRLVRDAITSGLKANSERTRRTIQRGRSEEQHQ
jgi:hypothetical protein